MLFNPHWSKPADVLSLDSLIAWLEQQPADKEYCYTQTGCCLLAQYFTAMGFSDVNMGGSFFYHDNRTAKLPLRWNDIALGHPRTFGAALASAKSLQARSAS